MISNLKPYPAYKDSGVSWLGEVPESWEVVTIRRKLRAYDGIKIGPFGSQLKLEQMADSGFKVYGQANVIARDFARGRKFIGQAKFDELSACEVRPGDLVVTMMGTSGRCARVPDDVVPGIMDSHLIRLRTILDIDRTFTARVIDEASYVKEQINIAGKGSIMHGLNSSMIKDLLLAVPPLPEQTTIVRFLDHADRKIRRYISAKQKLIKLLEEQKQAIIHRAVTRGLDPDVRLKPSGVEWLGDVPEHWEVLPIKRAFLSLDYGISQRSTDVGTIRLLTMGNIRNGQVSVPDTGGVATVETSLLLEAGDLLFNRTNSAELVGKVGLFEGADTPVTFASYLVRMRPRRKHEPGYLNLILNNVSVLSLARREAIPSLHQSNLNPTRYGRLQISLPPIHEQRAILQYLNAATAHLGRGITAAYAEISLLREFRTRLIADVVTGKLDVREVAASLPEESEEEELAPNVDEGAEEEAIEDAELETEAFAV